MSTTMAEYIMVILKSRWQIMWSWGCRSFVAVENGLKFHVQGYLFNGWVKVMYNEGRDTFDLYFLNNAKKIVKTVEDVYIDTLVDTIDYHVEKNGSFDYNTKVRQKYSLI